MSCSRHKYFVSRDCAEINSTFSDYVERTSIHKVPVADILLREGDLNGARVQVLKDGGCNTNVVSFDFIRDHRKRFTIVNSSFTVRNAKMKSVEESIAVNP